jgi:hypothetical protein
LKIELFTVDYTFETKGHRQRGVSQSGSENPNST